MGRPTQCALAVSAKHQYNHTNREDGDVPPVMIHPGRNDPCPCGSGKKYKKCCLRSVEESEFEYRRQRQVEAGLIPRLLDYAFETLGPDSLADAWEEFNDYEPVEDFDPESPMNIVFMPWYIFNWIHEFKARGKQVFETTIGESFLKKHKNMLTADEETFLLSAIRCPYSLCEVVEVKPGVGMKLLDMFRRYEYEVVERMASQSLKRGDIIYCATTQVGEIRSNVSTSPFALRPTAKRDVLDLRKQIAAEVGDDTLTDFDLHEFEADIRCLYLDLLAQMLAPPELINTDVTYKTTLLEPIEPAIAEVWEKAKIGAADKSSFSRARAAAAGGGFGVSGDSHSPSDSALPSDIEESPELLGMMEEIAQRHWDSWFSLPVPALNDMTPREASKTSEGRDLLESLLLYYESHDDGSSDNPFKPDIPALRRELGLK
jgi:hypothetical protein